MNETNHILKRIFSYSPPLQVCGKTKNAIPQRGGVDGRVHRGPIPWMDDEMKTTSRRQHPGSFCAQAGFVIHFR